MFKSITERRSTETWRIEGSVVIAVFHVCVCVCVYQYSTIFLKSNGRWLFPGNYLSHPFYLSAPCGMISVHILPREHSCHIQTCMWTVCLSVDVCSCLPMCELFVHPAHIRNRRELPSSSSASFTFWVIVSWGRDPSWRSHLRVNLCGQRPL